MFYTIFGRQRKPNPMTEGRGGLIPNGVGILFLNNCSRSRRVYTLYWRGSLGRSLFTYTCLLGMSMKLANAAIIL